MFLWLIIVTITVDNYFFHVDGILKKLIRIPVSNKDHAWKSELPVSLTEKKNNILIKAQKNLNPSLVQIKS